MMFVGFCSQLLGGIAFAVDDSTFAEGNTQGGEDRGNSTSGTLDK
jgi:hypothetical protein